MAEPETICSVLDQCGGCVHQRVPYAQQLERKKRRLITILEPLGVDRQVIGDVVGLSSPFGYRTRLVMPVAGCAGKLLFGLYRRGTMAVVDASKCLVQHPSTLEMAREIISALDHFGVAPTQSRSRAGWLHAIGVRTDPTTGKSEVTLCGRSYPMPSQDDIISALLDLPNAHALYLNVNRKRSSYPLDGVFRWLGGQQKTPFHLKKITFNISPESFFQTCQEGAERLVDTVRKLLPSSIDCFADLYGGVGVFSRTLRSSWKSALLVESNASSVRDLEADLQEEQGALPLRIVHAPVENALDAVMSFHPDVCVVDPPRRGCHPSVIECFAKASIETIIYVSCGEDALLRDTAALIDRGYRPDAVESVDMFPHTDHLEVVVRFRRRYSAAVL